MAANGYRGRFLWYELLTPNPEDAVDFYRDIVGWGSQDWEGGETPYRMWTNEERPGPPAWLCYAKVPDSTRPPSA